MLSIMKLDTHMSDENKIPKWIAIAASITTLSVPFFYIFGYAYDQGYLRIYGISNEFFARSIQEYLVLSFFACLGIATSILEFSTKNQSLFFMLALIVGCFALAVVFIHKHHLGNRLRKKLEKTKKHWLFDYIVFPSMFAAFALTAPYLVITAISMILVIPGIAYFNGQSVAKKEISSAKPCVYTNAAADECVFLLENGKPIISGRFVARSSTHLALFNNGKTTIYPIKEQLVEVVAVPQKPNLAVQLDAPNAARALP